MGNRDIWDCLVPVSGDNFWMFLVFTLTCALVASVFQFWSGHRLERSQQKVIVKNPGHSDSGSCVMSYQPCGGPPMLLRALLSSLWQRQRSIAKATNAAISRAMPRVFGAAWRSDVHG